MIAMEINLPSLNVLFDHPAKKDRANKLRGRMNCSILNISPGFCRLRSFTIKFDDDETGCRFSLTSFLLKENSASFADDHHKRRNWTGNTQSISTAATAWSVGE
jgi:hypothetical protein